VANPVFLGGDVHEHWVGHVKADYEDPRSASIGVEFCGTSITSRPGRPERIPVLLEENPHFVYGESRWRGYGIVDFAPSKLDATLRAVEDVAKPDAGVFTLAKFRVEAGGRRVEKA
jgi:alkaline phosphatase D